MLSDPLTLPCGLVIPNRVAKSAMTEALADRDDQPSEALVRLYGRWAHSGAGLLITGNIGIDIDHVVRPGDVVSIEGMPIEPWERWAQAANSGEAKTMVQICHAGRQAIRYVNLHPIAPSAVAAVKRFNMFGTPREATEDEILELIRRYGVAARRSELAGFHGAQIHAAHGYLLSQFLSPRTNVRTDRWGGTVENRARFLLEAVREVRRKVSATFAVSVKLNSADFQRGGFTEEDSLEVVRLLSNEGVDLLEISGGSYEQPASFGEGVPESTRAREAYFLEFARKVRKVSPLPIMLTGGFRTAQGANAALAENALDLVGFARPFAIVPELGKELLAGREVAIPPYPKMRGSLNSAAELGWYSQQLVRMGDGLEPDPKLSARRALYAQMVGDFFRAMGRKLRRYSSKSGRALIADRQRSTAIPRSVSGPSAK